ncbi:MAG: rod shape-determining protein [Alphaproteobacteria bacterium]|nr:MAG: rod shape-determining protein [Alphaproteobacteria bacterium]
MFDSTPDWATKKADFAIDLGTANTLVVQRSNGVVFEQPSVCCFDDDVDARFELFAAGTAAKQVVGREVKRLRTVRPLRNGVLVDVRATCELLKFAMQPIVGRRRFRRSRVVIGVPTDATQAERRALGRAAYDAGLAEPWLMSEPVLAAIGSGFSIGEARGRMVVDCGAGTTDVIVVSLGGICVSRSMRGGGDAVDAALIQHLHLKRHFHIGQSSGETLKLALSAALSTPGSTCVEVKGLDTRSGLPRVISVDIGELRPIIEKYAAEVAGVVRAVFALTDPDLAMGILEDGITLTGGAALTALVADRIEQETGIFVTATTEPKKAVARGLEVVLG